MNDKASRERASVNDRDPNVEMELCQLNFKVKQVLETLATDMLSTNVRKLRLFIEQTILEEEDIPFEIFHPWGLIDKLLAAVKKLDPVRSKFVVEETIQLCSKIFARWSIRDASSILAEERLPPEYLRDLFWKDNISDGIGIAITRLLATVYDGSDEVSQKLFEVIPMDAVADFVDRSEKIHLFPMLASFLRSIARYNVPEDKQEAFVMLCAKFVNGKRPDAMAYALEAISRMFGGNQDISQRLAQCLGDGFLDQIKQCLSMDQSVDPRSMVLVRRHCFAILGRMAMNGCNTPPCNCRHALASVSNDKDDIDVKIAAVFALHNMIMNRTKMSGEQCLSDQDVMAIIGELLPLSESQPFGIQCELLKNIPALCLTQVPPSAYHSLVRDLRIFHFVQTCCANDIIHTVPDALDRILQLIARLFEQAEQEGWNRECAEMFVESDGPAIIEHVREAGRPDLLERTEAFYRTHIECYIN